MKPCDGLISATESTAARCSPLPSFPGGGAHFIMQRRNVAVTLGECVTAIVQELAERLLEPIENPRGCDSRKDEDERKRTCGEGGGHLLASPKLGGCEDRHEWEQDRPEYRVDYADYRVIFSRDPHVQICVKRGSSEVADDPDDDVPAHRSSQPREREPERDPCQLRKGHQERDVDPAKRKGAYDKGGFPNATPVPTGEGASPRDHAAFLRAAVTPWILRS